MFRKLLPGLSLIGAFAVAEADTLLIDGVEISQTTRTDRPSRGETKARVEERFGQPSLTVAAVGDPPISRWEYPSFVVYFEHDHVIHAVPRR
ncbi:MAG TPA: hypothetical protein VMR74_09455 [Gammaproteobacteria bacterium]|nr:hypothetical protein [Gammaproteobacteria bacterium]